MPQNVDHAFPPPNLFVVERRKEYRLDIKIPVVVSGIDSKKLVRYEVKAVTKNVTRNGACFELTRGLVREGSTLTLTLGKKFEAKCRVIWISEGAGNLDLLGVEFVSVKGQWVLYDIK
ncbi:MAG: PilZ domain-containing protein [Acidobacteriia bacterium]|nr:PilZ domain-containing protein [Terriglobia bacterium]